ncbi:MAG: zinc-ribbon domain-containing protein [Oscillospiraceae bacterium]|nr:zinc-ribbon domain-containing protein [Oscillospiraceae bacterium]
MAKFCGQCGSELKENAAFCGECGAKVVQQVEEISRPAPQKPVYAQPEPRPQPVQPIQRPAPQPPAYTQKDEEEQPKRNLFDKKTDDNMSETVKTGFYFWMSFLYAIPVIGWVICLFNALINKNKSKRNHARATVLTVVVMMAISFAVTFAVKTAVNMAIEKAGIDVRAIKENGISTEIVMDFLEDKGMLPEELADMAGLIDSVTGILGGEGELNLEGVDTEQINDVLEQFTGEEGSIDFEALIGALGSLESNSSSDSASE